MNLVAKEGDTTSFLPPLTIHSLVSDSVFTSREGTCAHTSASNIFVLLSSFQLLHPSGVQLVCHFLFDYFCFGNFFQSERVACLVTSRRHKCAMQSAI